MSPFGPSRVGGTVEHIVFAGLPARRHQQFAVARRKKRLAVLPRASESQRKPLRSMRSRAGIRPLPHLHFARRSNSMTFGSLRGSKNAPFVIVTRHFAHVMPAGNRTIVDQFVGLIFARVVRPRRRTTGEKVLFHDYRTHLVAQSSKCGSGQG
jgi:hypothetical protein